MDVAIWRTYFPELSWQEFGDTPTEVMQRAMVYINTRDKVMEGKRELSNGQ